MNNNSEFMPVECLNVPKVLFYDKQYEDLSMDAKLIYALLLDRKEMAIRNEWVDEYGDTYVIYPKQEIKKYLNISRYRIDQALAELEEHDQMVEVAVPYPGKLCQFYVKDITDNEKQMEEDIMKKMKESNGENFCRASGCGYFDGYHDAKHGWTPSNESHSSPRYRAIRCSYDSNYSFVCKCFYR